MKTMQIEIEYPLEIMVKVKCSISPPEPMTHDYPGCPAEIEDLEYICTQEDIDEAFEQAKPFVKEDIREEKKKIQESYINQ